MAKAKAKRKYKTGPKKGKIIPLTPGQRKFGTVARAANVVCHRETNSVSLYKKCMSREMSANLATGKRKSAAKKATKKITCVGLRKSGPKKGTLKPGYTWQGKKGKGGCPRKVK